VSHAEERSQSPRRTISFFFFPVSLSLSLSLVKYLANNLRPFNMFDNKYVVHLKLVSARTNRVYKRLSILIRSVRTFPQFFTTSVMSFQQFIIGGVYGFSAVILPQLELPDSFVQVDVDQASWIGMRREKPVRVYIRAVFFFPDFLPKFNTGFFPLCCALAPQRVFRSCCRPSARCCSATCPTDSDGRIRYSWRTSLCSWAGLYSATLGAWTTFTSDDFWPGSLPVSTFLLLLLFSKYRSPRVPSWGKNVAHNCCAPYVGKRTTIIYCMQLYTHTHTHTHLD